VFVCLPVSLIVLILIWKPLYFHLRRLTKYDAVVDMAMTIYGLCPEECGRGGGELYRYLSPIDRNISNSATCLLRIQICCVVTRQNCHCGCYYRQYIFSLFSLSLFFYLFACLTCFVIIGSNEPVSCPKFYCRTGVYPLSALEQHALRFAVIDYNIHIWGQDRVKVYLTAFIEWNTIQV
jgi:hypothetical protein